MKTRAMMLATAAAVALTGSAGAANFHGWYLGLEAGAGWVDDASAVDEFGPFGAPIAVNDIEVQYDTGWAVFGTVGYDFGRWRIEGEVGYRDNEISAATYPGLGGAPAIWADPSMNELSLMANVHYDIPLSSRLQLSLGVGAGADRARFETGGGSFSDDDWNFAYQGIVGFSYAISSGTDLTLNYRYLRVTDAEFSEERGANDVLNRYDDITKHTVTLGLRFDLSPDALPPPPAPVPPAPPAMGPKNFVIFFGFNKCNITQEADAVLSEAAAAARSGGGASVSIVGHTDTVGSNGYNQKLSECRANAAKANMVGKGIPAGAISASGRGEGQLMVQTGDGVKEPQNRRANISIR